MVIFPLWVILFWDHVYLGYLYYLLYMYLGWSDIHKILQIQNGSIHTTEAFPSQNPASNQNIRGAGFFLLFSHACFVLSKAKRGNEIVLEQYRD